MSRDGADHHYRRGFPGDDPQGHLVTIPACGALGLRQSLPPEGPVGVAIDAALPAVRDGAGRIDRGAALILADQATAAGVFATLDAPVPMMTLDLRLDWFAALPAGPLTCAVDDVLREGDMAFVRAPLDDGARRVGAATARYLIGGFPGGGGGTVDAPAPAVPPSTRRSFEEWLGACDGDGILSVAPRGEHVGARGLPAFHGGVIAALLERAGCGAADPAMRPLDIEIRYLAPGDARRTLHARAEPRRLGRRAATIDVTAFHDDPARPVAVARMLFAADAAGEPHAFDLRQ